MTIRMPAVVDHYALDGVVIPFAGVPVSICGYHDDAAFSRIRDDRVFGDPALLDVIGGLRLGDGLVVDVGAGLGAEAVFLALSYPDRTVVAVESAESSLLLLQKNATANGLDSRIEICTQLWGAVSPDDGSGGGDLDAWCGDRRVALLVIHGSGNGAAIVRGGLSAIGRSHPVIVVANSGNLLAGEIGTLVAPLGYIPIGVLADGSGNVVWATPGESIDASEIERLRAMPSRHVAATLVPPDTGLDDAIQGLDASIGNRVIDSEAKISESISAIGDAIAVLDNSLGARLATSGTGLGQAIDDLANRLDGLDLTVSGQVAALREAIETLHGAMGGVKLSVEQQSSDIDVKIKSATDGVGGRIDSLGASFDDRLAGSETRIGHSIEQVENSLRNQMASSRSDLDETISGLAGRVDQLAESWSGQLADQQMRLGSAIDGLGDSIDGLDGRIDGLGDRVGGLDGRVDEWAKKLDKRLSNSDVQTGKSIASLRSSLDRRVADGVQELTARVAGFEDSISARMAEREARLVGALNGLIDSLNDREAAIEARIDQVVAGMASSETAMRRTVDDAIATMAAHVDAVGVAQQREAGSRLEQALNEAEQWRVLSERWHDAYARLSRLFTTVAPEVWSSPDAEVTASAEAEKPAPAPQPEPAPASTAEQRVVSLRALLGTSAPEMETRLLKGRLRLFKGCSQARRLRIAAIVDDFSRNGLEPECDVQNLTPQDGIGQLVASQPDLLFVESAWRGVDDSWHNTVPKTPPELLAIIDWCNQHDVPTVFWAKEDPIHFATFIDTARHFDYVFTTDLDCIPRYRRELGHDRIGVMPFASQPKVHNPINDRSRKAVLVFAGGYYTRYTERMHDLREAIDGASRVMPVEIFDRALGTTLEAYKFPEQYERYIVGTLAPDEIDQAYKGYDFALNMNSIKSSQSMCARRVYELLSSGTPTVSNYARGLKNVFGDIIPMSDSADGIEDHLRGLVDDPVACARIRSAGLHKVLREHTYGERLRYIVARILGDPYEPHDSEGLAVMVVANQAELELCADAVARQRDVSLQSLVLVDGDPAWSPVIGETIPGAVVIQLAKPEGHITLGSVTDAELPVLVFDASRWYGPTYAAGLLDGFKYADVPAVTKAPRRNRAAYSFVKRSTVDPAASAIAGAWLADVRLDDLAVAVRANTGKRLDVLQIDSIDYSMSRENEASRPSSLPAERCGVSLNDLVRAAESLLRDGGTTDHRVLSPALLPKAGKLTDSMRVGLTGVGFNINSSLEGFEYVWLPPVSVAEAWPQNAERVLYVEADGQPEVLVAARTFDSTGKRLGSAVIGGTNSALKPDIPNSAVSVQVGLRVSGSGVAMIGRILFDDPGSTILGSLGAYSNSILCVTDAYPSYTDIYKYGFVQSRLTDYARNGVDVDLCISSANRSGLSYREYEGQEVCELDSARLAALLAENRYQTILVHFLTPYLWTMLRECPATTRILVWIHGSEIQPWWRRLFDYETDAELETAKVRSDARQRFWHSVFAQFPPNLHLVIVSQAFADEIMEDYDVHLSRDQYSVIHNPIDTTLFEYHEKDPAQRNRILSIRPFASAKYANDLSVAAILALQGEPWFDELQFTVVGEGRLFSQVTAPIANLPNVTLREEFLNHREIAELHRAHGVLLTPTRCDAQGVSRDEAMSSGLVPLTSDVPAIHEFVSQAEGFIAPLEDFNGLADGIRRLHDDPDLFCAMSKAAAQRVRRQTSEAIVTAAEIGLIVDGGRAGMDTEAREA